MAGFTTLTRHRITFTAAQHHRRLARGDVAARPVKCPDLDLREFRIRLLLDGSPLVKAIRLEPLQSLQPPEPPELGVALSFLQDLAVIRQLMGHNEHPLQALLRIPNQLLL